MAMLVFGKHCQITENSYFSTFRQKYRQGIPFIFRLVVLDGDGQMTKIEDIDDFLLFDLKIKDKAELDRKDVEYDLLRLLD